MTSLRVATAKLFERLQAEDAVRYDAEFAVAPRTLEEAAEVIAHAADQGMPVGIVGAGTHTGIGGPTTADLVVATSRLGGVIDYEPEDLTVVVGAGTRVADLAAMLADDGLTAVLPETPGDATVGGTIAAGASGYRRLRYGATRERVLEVTMATGYGRVVRGGGRVVKNSTGFDLARVAVGSLGSLGLVGSVCLKLWPEPIATATAVVDDPAKALRAAYRPQAVIETEHGTLVYLGGTEAELAQQAAALGSGLEPGLRWPDPIATATRFELRLPPRLVAEGVSAVSAIPGAEYRAQHGVGVIEAGADHPDPATVRDLRVWAESVGGALVLVAGPAALYDEVGAWGTPPASIDVQRRIKAAFDPAGILNPGKLAGGL